MTISRPPAHRLLASLVSALAAALAAGCGGPPAYEPAPLDRFTFPVALGVEPGGDLLVASSNFDLSYAEDDGGSLIRLVPEATTSMRRSAARFPSFGGEIALADAAACGLERPEALTVSRLSTDLFRFRIEEDGGLTCGAGCTVGLGPATVIATDPFGVEVVCAPGRPPRAYVGFLAAMSGVGRIAEIDLASGAAVEREVPLGAVRSFAHDAEHARLYFTGAGLVPQAPLRWFELGGGCTLDVSAGAGCPLAVRDLSSFVRGADLQGIALSNPQAGLVRRAYIAARLYDADLAQALGGRPNFDIGGVLLVLELQEQRGGDVDVVLADAVPLGIGAAEVAVLPTRARQACPGDPAGCPRRDVVVVSSTEAGQLWIYDDELGAVVKTFGADPVTGHAITGLQPFALAVKDGGGTDALVYVASFGEAFVTTFRVPLDDPGAADADPRRIGPEVP